jgi:hypothetical protein
VCACTASMVIALTSPLSRRSVRALRTSLGDSPSSAAPFFDGGTLDDWLATFAWIGEVAPAVVVPDHGPIGDIEQIRALRRYFDSLLSGSVEVPAEFSEWEYPESYAENREAVRSSRGRGGTSGALGS